MPRTESADLQVLSFSVLGDAGIDRFRRAPSRPKEAAGDDTTVDVLRGVMEVVQLLHGEGMPIRLLRVSPPISFGIPTVVNMVTGIRHD